MEIKTKFNIGDKLWRILADNTGVLPFEVKEIRVFYRKNRVSKKLELIIGYQYKPLFCYEEEADCFATEEEAQAECDRRNSETKI